MYNTHVAKAAIKEGFKLNHIVLKVTMVSLYANCHLILKQADYHT
jgi:hypothetical protein